MPAAHLLYVIECASESCTDIRLVLGKDGGFWSPKLVLGLVQGCSTVEE